MPKPIRFGTLGTARITPRALIYPCVDEPGAFVAAVAARDKQRATAFAHHHNISRVWDNYQQVIDDPKVDVVYNPLPITAHRDWTIAALNAGKHVLCEKSLASNANEAQAMADAAAANGKVLMDAFHYRYHPVFHRAREIVANGMLGDVREVSATFHVPITDTGDIRMNYATGGGVTMDIGCYPISWVRHITALEPLSITAVAQEGPPLVDVMLQTEMEFAGGIRATTSGDMRANVGFEAWLDVIGQHGRLKVQNPIAPQMGHSIELTIAGKTTVEVCDRRASYGYQLDAFLEAVHTNTAPLTGAADGVAQMRVIDASYQAAGLPVRGLNEPST